MRRAALVVGALAAVAALRLALPSIVRHYANSKLSRLEHYRGRVENVDIHLWRGAYAIRRFKLDRVDGADRLPLFTCDRIDLSVEWRALLRGYIVGTAAFEHPTFNLEPTAASVATRAKADDSGSSALGALMPLKINRLIVRDGEIHYRDRRSKPEFDVRLSSVSALAENLSSVRSSKKELPASIEARATVFDSGTLTLAMEVDPLAASPTFMLRSTLEGVRLAKINDLLEAYANVRVKRGDFELYTEVAAKDGSFIGYIKPIVRNLAIDKDSSRSPLRKLWANVVAAAGSILKNSEKEQVATKIPFEGKFGEADTDLWTAVGNLLKNAFVKALTPSLDRTIGLDDLKK